MGDKNEDGGPPLVLIETAAALLMLGALLLPNPLNELAMPAKPTAMEAVEPAEEPKVTVEEVGVGAEV